MCLKQIVRVLLVWALIVNSSGLVLAQDPSPKVHTNVDQNKKHLSQPFCFTENNGQWNTPLLYIGKTPFGHIGFSKDSVYYHIISNKGKQNHVVKISLVKGNMENLIATGLQPYSYHYFKGNNPDHWITNVQNYTKITYKDVYPQIDLHYFFQRNTPKYEFHVKPGADPNQIQILVEGGTVSLAKDSKSLFINDKTKIMSDQDLQVFTKKTKKPIEAFFKRISHSTYAFQIEQYKTNEEIVIDPMLHGTFFSGENDDMVLGQDIDSTGDVVITGYTMNAIFFPATPGSYDSIMDGYASAYVAKFDSTLTSLRFCTFLEGSIYDPSNMNYGCKVKVDQDNHIIVAGMTYSPLYPVTPFAYDTTFNGGRDLFITKLNSSGNQLIYSTFIGGSSEERINENSPFSYQPMALSPDGSVYLALNTDSLDFPMTDGSFSHVGPVGLGDYSQIAICHLSSDGSELLASTYFGGTWDDFNPSIELDAQNNLILTGCTYSPDIPVTHDAYKSSIEQAEYGSAFIAKFDLTLSTVLYCTYVMEVFLIHNSLISIGLDNSIYVSFVAEFFTQIIPYHEDFLLLETSQDPLYIDPPQMTGIVIFHFSDDGMLLATRSIDGLGYELLNDTAVDSSGYLYLSGFSDSPDFPVTTDADFSYYHSWDIFVTRISPDLSTISYSSFFPGYFFDICSEILITDENIIYLSGFMASPDDCFILSVSGFDTFPQSGAAGFICSFRLPLDFPGIPSLSANASNEAFTFQWTESLPGTFSIQGYALYRSIDYAPFSSVPYKIILGSSTLLTIDSLLPPGESYQYALKAFDIFGNYSGLSNVYEYKRPSIPANASAISVDEGIKVTWDTSVAGSSSVSGYNIYRSQHANFSSSTKVGQVSFPSTSFIDTNLEFNKTYYYRVQAFDLVFFGSLMSSIFSGIAPLNTPILTLSIDTMKKEFTDDEYIQFKVYVYNIGFVTATNVVLSMSLPDMIGFTSVNGATVLSSNGIMISFAVGSIAKGSFKAIDMICQVKGKVDKDHKASIFLEVICHEKTSNQATIELMMKIKKNNKGSLNMNITVSNLEQDPETGKRFIKAGQSIIIGYNLSGGVPPYKITIDWGDGTSTVLVIDRDGNMSGQISHKYDLKGHVKVKIRVEDASGQSKESDFNIEIR